MFLWKQRREEMVLEVGVEGNFSALDRLEGVSNSEVLSALVAID